MARLPDPIIKKIEILQSESDNNIKIFYKTIGQAIRKAEMDRKRGDSKRE